MTFSITGNSYGCDFYSNGTTKECCLGCGAQARIVNCADAQIRSQGESFPVGVSKPVYNPCRWNPEGQECYLYPTKTRVTQIVTVDNTLPHSTTTSTIKSAKTTVSPSTTKSHTKNMASTETTMAPSTSTILVTDQPKTPIVSTSASSTSYVPTRTSTAKTLDRLITTPTTHMSSALTTTARTALKTTSVSTNVLQSSTVPTTTIMTQASTVLSKVPVQITTTNAAPPTEQKPSTKEVATNIPADTTAGPTSVTPDASILTSMTTTQIITTATQVAALTTSPSPTDELARNATNGTKAEKTTQSTVNLEQTTPLVSTNSPLAAPSQLSFNPIPLVLAASQLIRPTYSQEQKSQSDNLLKVLIAMMLKNKQQSARAPQPIVVVPVYHQRPIHLPSVVHTSTLNGPQTANANGRYPSSQHYGRGYAAPTGRYPSYGPSNGHSGQYQGLPYNGVSAVNDRQINAKYAKISNTRMPMNFQPKLEFDKVPAVVREVETNKHHKYSSPHPVYSGNARFVPQKHPTYPISQINRNPQQRFQSSGESTNSFLYADLEKITTTPTDIPTASPEMTSKSDNNSLHERNLITGTTNSLQKPIFIENHNYVMPETSFTSMAVETPRALYYSPPVIREPLVKDSSTTVTLTNLKGMGSSSPQYSESNSRNDFIGLNYLSNNAHAEGTSQPGRVYNPVPLSSASNNGALYNLNYMVSDSTTEVPSRSKPYFQSASGGYIQTERQAFDDIACSTERLKCTANDDMLPLLTIRIKCALDCPVGNDCPVSLCRCSCF